MLAEPRLTEGPWTLLDPPNRSLTPWGGWLWPGVQEDPEVPLPSQAGSAAGIALESGFQARGEPPGAPAEL